MRVCDKHRDATAFAIVTLSNTDERFDLCASCLEQIRSFIIGETKTLDPPKPKGIMERIKDSVKAG